MSTFWSWYVIVITLGNIAACFWLIRWATRRRTGEAAEGNVTGHTWDENLQEYNNPLPRWWLWLFYITIIFSLIYIVIYPGAGAFSGTAGWTSAGQYEEEMAEANKHYGPVFAGYAKQDITTLAGDARAKQAGERLFLTYCATCHGSDAGGAPGFPSLSDNDWLYGGDPAAIKASIMNGRTAVMPPMGAALGTQGVEEVTAYVLSLSGRAVDTTKASAGKAKFAACAGCHGPDGKGNTAMGAPNLTDNIWLYGGSAGVVAQSITNGRMGVMPAHGNFLGNDKAHLLAAYVYGLSKNK